MPAGSRALEAALAGFEALAGTQLGSLVSPVCILRVNQRSRLRLPKCNRVTDLSRCVVSGQLYAEALLCHRAFVETVGNTWPISSHPAH